MLKLKMYRGFVKRIKISGSGKYLRKKVGKSYFLSGKLRKRKRNLKKMVVVDVINVKVVKKFLLYL